jgi:hypothetical protein
MGNMFQLLDRLDKADIRPIIITCLNDSTFEITSFIQRQQKRGLNSNDETFYFYHSLIYSIDKEKQNPLPGLGRADFFVTGDYYKGIQTVVNAGQYSFSTFGMDIKSPRLEKLIDDDGGDSTLIYGMDKESKIELASILKPKIVQGLVKELGL